MAQANNLPVPFFANLIWQESSFDTRTISRAGAQGIAQFMPRTAVQFGLINPFEPIHALNVAGKFVRDLNKQFGNLGLAAAAYNAGPRRVSDWLAKKGEMPGETRNYVIRVTGRPIEEWVGAKNDVEMLLMPAKAPCVEVAEAVEAQAKAVRMSRLIAELAAHGEPDARQEGRREARRAGRRRGRPRLARARDRDGPRRAEAARRAADCRQDCGEERSRGPRPRLPSKRRSRRSLLRGRPSRTGCPPSRSGRPRSGRSSRPPDRTPPASAEKDTQRSAVRVVSTADVRDPTRPDGKGTPVDGNKVEPAKTDGSKPDADKLEPAKAEEAKAAEQAKPRRRIERIARYLYTDALNRPF